LVSEFRLTAGCVLMDLASPAVSQTSVYANGLNVNHKETVSWTSNMFLLVFITFYICPDNVRHT